MIDHFALESNNNESAVKGMGTYDVSLEKFMSMLEPPFMESMGQARTSKECIRTNDGIILPLINDSMKTLGIVYLELKNPFNEIELLKIFATQVATSINNIHLHSLVSIKNDELARTYNELQRRYMDAIQVLRLAVDAKDVYTRDIPTGLHIMH